MNAVLTAESQTQFVPGWAIGLPLLLLAAILAWAALSAAREEPASDERERPLLDDVWDEAAREPEPPESPADRLSRAAFAELQRRKQSAGPVPGAYHLFHAAHLDVVSGSNPDQWPCSVVVDGEPCGLTYYEHWENR